MNPNRELAPLAPKSVPSHVSNQNRTKASSATTNSSAKGRRNRHSDAEWESQKDTIANLYVQEDLTAEEVLDKLEKDHSFKVG
jgi:hypothetical protein